MTHLPGPEASNTSSAPIIDVAVGRPSNRRRRSSRSGSRRPWFRRPSAWWSVAVVPLISISITITSAPRIEVYTYLACGVLRPDIFEPVPRNASSSFPEMSFPWSPQLSLIPDSDIAPTPETGFWAGVDLPGSFIIHQSNTSGDFFEGEGEHDPDGIKRRRRLCSKDPKVAATVASLSAVISTLSGILLCLTAGFWGSFSDRYGRRPLLLLSSFGMLTTTLNFIFATIFFARFPLAHYMLIFGPTVEGLLGGYVSNLATTQAYVADTTSPTNRAKFLSTVIGAYTIGTAIGPTFGSLLIRLTGGNVLAPFVYGALPCTVLYIIVVALFLPESLSKREMESARERWRQDIEGEEDESHGKVYNAVLRLFRRLFAIVSPLGVFLPYRPKTKSLKKPRREWGLTLVAFGIAFVVVVMGGSPYRILYANMVFNWDSEITGYWLSLTSITGALWLTALLPSLIQILRRPWKSSSSQPNSPNTSSPSERTPLLSNEAGEGDRKHLPPSSKFDLRLAQTSLVVEITAVIGMAFAPTSLFFALAWVSTAFGMGFNPALTSLLLSLYTARSKAHSSQTRAGEDSEERGRGGGASVDPTQDANDGDGDNDEPMEVGRLFGASNVLEVLCGQILSPSLFGFVYVKTVRVFPQAVFLVSAFSISLALLSLLFVRLPRKPEVDLSLGRDEEEDEDGEGEGGDDRGEGSSNVIRS